MFKRILIKRLIIDSLAMAIIGLVDLFGQIDSHAAYLQGRFGLSRGAAIRCILWR